MPACTTMVENILKIERDAFLFLNGAHSPFWDNVMWLFTGKVVWIPIALLIIGVILYKKNWREWLLIFLAIALVITLCDQLASSFFKPTFERFRPSHHPDFKDFVHTVGGYRGGRYGFISSHACNAFGFATFLSLLFRYRWFSLTIFGWAVLMSYTRIYLGVHFLSDIIPAAILGVGIGYLVFLLYKFVRKKILQWSSNYVAVSGNALAYSYARQHLVIAGIFLTIAFILIFHVPLMNQLYAA